MNRTETLAGFMALEPAPAPAPRCRQSVSITIGTGTDALVVGLHNGAVKDSIIETLRSAGLITIQTVAMPGPALGREALR